MFTLYKRRITGDMIEVFKILNKFDKINLEVLFEMNNASVTGGNGMKFKVQKINTIARKSYFIVRDVDHWNRLPASVVSFKTIDISIQIKQTLPRNRFTLKKVVKEFMV